MSNIPAKEISRILSEANGNVGLYIEDCQTGEVFTVNGEKQFPAASTIKVPMLAMLLKDAQDGLIDLDQPREIAEVNRVPNGVICSLNKGFKPTLRDMAWLMIVVSDNLATNEIIDVIGYDRFNKFWQEWGCGSTKLLRKMMEAVKEGRNNFTSASDMGKILSAVARGELYNKQIADEMFSIMRDQKLTARLPHLLPTTTVYNANGEVAEGMVMVSHKTGSNPGLVHDVGIFELPGHRRYIVAVYTQDFPTVAEATVFINNISLAVYNGMK